MKHYQTVNNKSVSEYPAVEQDEILSSAFRTDRKDFFESKTVIKTLQKNKIKNWFYSLQILFSIHWRMKDIGDFAQYSIFQ